jgi:lipoprotein-anchoring transpeptidase ErfK/SrfK
MPDRRPPPIRLNLAPRNKKRPGNSGGSKPKSPRKPRSSRSRGNDSTLPYWIAGGLVVALIALAALYYETPEIQKWFVNREARSLPVEPLPESAAPVVPPPTETPLVKPKPQPPVLTKEQQDAEKLKKLKEKAAEETRLLIERTAPQPLPATNAAPKLAFAQPPPVVTPPPMTQALPAPGQPVSVVPKPGAPVRAQPVDLNKLDTERIAAYQVALERIHFSCGFIDGDQGMRTRRMLRAYQASRGLPITGFLDQPTRDSIGEPGDPFLSYTVTADDVGSIMPKPPTWRAKAAATRLGYNEIWEMLAEKFHCTRAYLKALNCGVTTPVAGTEIIGPKVYPAAPVPKAASLRISLADTSIEPLDASGKIIGFFPCSIAKDKAKRPHGLLTVKVVDPHPDYTFDPALFADASKEEGITHKLTIPPGPRNPVGTTWVGLSLPGYGIHGTPEPENISRTQSHGCFRLANWNAEKVLKMVKVGTPVDVVE